ncbi:hypothetical protein [Hafnia paralvei]|uniref:hypothetical protein n=1 Tax=Hafnia paralvei TaxID=546367 RepID=UPI00300D11A7
MHGIKNLSLICCIGLTGCVVADLDSSNYDYFPYVQTFQKPQTMGHTDVQKRRDDLYECGVNKKFSLNSWDEKFRRNSLQAGETMEQLDTRTKKVEGCMKSKGYVLLDFSECGPRKKPSGLCN